MALDFAAAVPSETQEFGDSQPDPPGTPVSKVPAVGAPPTTGTGDADAGGGLTTTGVPNTAADDVGDSSSSASESEEEEQKTEAKPAAKKNKAILQVMTLDNREEVTQAIYNAIMYKVHQEVRGPESLPFRGDISSGTQSQLDLGTALYVAGTHLRRLGRTAMEALLDDDCPFSLQLGTYLHNGVPWLFLAVWMPLQPVSFRCFLRAEKLGVILTQSGISNTASSEEAHVQEIMKGVRDAGRAQGDEAGLSYLQTCAERMFFIRTSF